MCIGLHFKEDAFREKQKPIKLPEFYSSYSQEKIEEFFEKMNTQASPCITASSLNVPI